MHNERFIEERLDILLQSLRKSGGLRFYHLIQKISVLWTNVKWTGHRCIGFCSVILYVVPQLGLLTYSLIYIILGQFMNKRLPVLRKSILNTRLHDLTYEKPMHCVVSQLDAQIKTLLNNYLCINLVKSISHVISNWEIVVLCIVQLYTRSITCV